MTLHPRCVALLVVLAWVALAPPAFATQGSFANHEDPVLRALWAEGLELESREGAGSTFRIFLPRLKGAQDDS